MTITAVPKQIPCYICQEEGPASHINLHQYDGHGVCMNCDMLWVPWLVKGLKPCQQGYCASCMKKLVPIGYKRINGKDHPDWDTRLMHKKCWLEYLDYFNDNEGGSVESDSDCDDDDDDEHPKPGQYHQNIRRACKNRIFKRT